VNAAAVAQRIDIGQMLGWRRGLPNANLQAKSQNTAQPQLVMLFYELTSLTCGAVNEGGLFPLTGLAEAVPLNRLPLLGGILTSQSQAPAEQ
jgi:hypothetical protein